MPNPLESFPPLTELGSEVGIEIDFFLDLSHYQRNPSSFLELYTPSRSLNPAL